MSAAVKTQDVTSKIFVKNLYRSSSLRCSIDLRSQNQKISRGSDQDAAVLAQLTNLLVALIN